MGPAKWVSVFSELLYKTMPGFFLTFGRRLSDQVTQGIVPTSKRFVFCADFLQFPANCGAVDTVHAVKVRSILVAHFKGQIIDQGN